MHSAAESPRVFGDLSHGLAGVNNLLIGIWPRQAVVRF
jgi:hypothetical protein